MYILFDIFFPENSLPDRVESDHYIRVHNPLLIMESTMKNIMKNKYRRTLRFMLTTKMLHGFVGMILGFVSLLYVDL